jgi:ribosome-associated protein
VQGSWAAAARVQASRAWNRIGGTFNQSRSLIVSHPSPTPHRRARAEPADASLSAARQAASLCLDLKAHDVVLLDVRGVTDMTDCFVIASGTSDTHVRSIARNVAEGMAAAGNPPLHTEGESGGRWVLLDFVDIVVHVFHPEMRDFYQLERLWSDARPVAIEPQGATL